jgi:TonB family protein
LILPEERLFVGFYGETTRNMKTSWANLSARRPYTFILSVSLHMLILSIPVSMVIEPQVQEMELFVSIEDIRIPPESVKTQMETKKPQPEPVKEIIKTIKAPRLQIKKPQVSEPIKEVRVEPVNEFKKEPAEETKEQSLKVESKSMSQSAAETRETFFVPTMSNITKGNIGLSTRERSIGMASGVGKQANGESLIGKKSGVEKHQPVSHNVTGGDTGYPIETRFGASVAPAFLHREMPIYPMMARKLGKEGKVLLRLTIDEKGNLLGVDVIERGGYGFTEAAMEAVKKSTFLPAKKDGKPIASRALLPVRFRLERN